MQDESNSPIVLLYFKVRGKLQPIRNLCCYLDLEVTEVHLENEDSKRRLSEEVKGALRGLKVDKSALPLLAHEGNIIYDVVPIMNYLCRRFNANHLLGKDIRQRVTINLLRPASANCLNSSSPKNRPWSTISSVWPKTAPPRLMRTFPRLKP